MKDSEIMASEYVKQLVMARLSAMPPNVSFSIGRFGSYSRDELIEHVRRGSQVGEATVEMQLHFLRASNIKFTILKMRKELSIILSKEAAF